MTDICSEHPVHCPVMDNPDQDEDGCWNCKHQLVFPLNAPCADCVNISSTGTFKWEPTNGEAS